jgi:hypothetical protein
VASLAPLVDLALVVGISLIVVGWLVALVRIRQWLADQGVVLPSQQHPC